MTEATPVEEERGNVVLTSWEFVGRVPTVEDVRGLLATLPPVWGVPTEWFIDYVQALPQKKKVAKPHPTNPALTVDEYVDAYTLYMSVAGRVKMLETAAERNGWRVDFVPEPATPTGLPGYLNVEKRLVYRVYVKIKAPIGPARLIPAGSDEQAGRTEVAKFLTLGSKHGTAWVPAEGGKNAAGSNPYEKVETSALGRALAAWGFGVLPGSGIASLEEIDQVRGNREFLEAEERPQRGRGRRRPADVQQHDKPVLIQDALALAEEVRQERGMTEEQMNDRVGNYLSTRLGIPGAYDPTSGIVNWDPVQPGQVVLLRNDLANTLRRYRDEQAPV